MFPIATMIEHNHTAMDLSTVDNLTVRSQIHVPLAQHCEQYNKLFIHERYYKECRYIFKQRKKYSLQEFQSVIDSLFDEYYGAAGFFRIFWYKGMDSGLHN